MPATFVISLDFELLWGVHDVVTTAGYGRNLLGVRQALPAMLARFATYDVPSTWAVVGMASFSRRDELMDALPAVRPTYQDGRLSTYTELDRLGADEAEDPYRLGGSLVDLLAADPRVEIASHTFAHYYALEPGQTLAHFRADLVAAKAAAARRGLTLRSLVFPRNQYAPEHLEVAAQEGFVAYRGNPRPWMYHPSRHGADGWLRRAARLADAHLPITGTHSRCSVGPRRPVNVPATRFLRPVAARWSPVDAVGTRRIVEEIRQVRPGDVYHLWWHPHNFGAAPEANLARLDTILRTVAELRDRGRLACRTMADCAAALDVAA